MFVDKSANVEFKMDDDQDEMRFVCKLCDKRYPSGKSLGGHMRSHVIAATSAAAAAANSAESDDKFDPINKKNLTLIINENGIENGNANSYGLRENPKKSWRAVGSSSSTLPFPNEKVCKQCGKGFQSLKALCGHMAFHSDKDRGFKDYDYSWTSENLDHEDTLIEDSHSDTEETEPICVTRSKSKRYKKVVVVKPPSFSLTYSNNNSNHNYESSPVSEIDELDQEEVAMCLMMLSKDSTNWAGVNSVVESSDNNSIVLETKLSSVDIKNSKKEWTLVKNETESCTFENSNSGNCKNGIKKVESDISVEEHLKNGDQKQNGSKGANEFNFKNLSYEEKQEIRRNLFREFGYDDSLKKRIRDDDDDSYYPEKDGSYKKRNKYECMNCNKVFSSFQGLGGHRPCHKKNNNNSDVEIARNQKAKYEKKMRPKKNKGHECPICFRMFKSGQALGGHKRSHFLNGSVDRINHMMAPIEDEEPMYNDMIDLNLPAPEDD